METELLQLLLQHYLRHRNYIPDVVETYIKDNWCCFTNEDRRLMQQYLFNNIPNYYNMDDDEDVALGKWLYLLHYMESTIVLSEEAYKQFVYSLENPPSPSPALIEIFKDVNNKYEIETKGDNWDDMFNEIEK